MKKIFALVLCSIFSIATNAADLTPDEYIEIFSKPSIIQKVDAIQTLEWAGLSDPRIFDLLEKDLLENYQTAESGAVIRALYWFARGLSFSGNEKYFPTLEAVAKDGAHKKLRKFGESSQVDLYKYQEWNAQINQNHADISAGYPSDQKRFTNMLESGNFELIRLAGKRIHREHLYEQDMLDVAATTVKNHYQSVDDKVSIDAVAWVIRAIAGSADFKYKPMIEDIAENASNKKIRKHAKKYLGYYE